MFVIYKKNKEPLEEKHMMNTHNSRHDFSGTTKRLLLLSALGAFTLSAADLTVDSPLVIAGSQSYDNVYANANITLGTDVENGTLNIAQGKLIYLPGSDGHDVSFTYRKGSIMPGNNRAGYSIGKYSGRGGIVVEAANAVELGRIQIESSATPEGDYVDFLTIGNGTASSGHFYPTRVTKILNNGTTTARIRFSENGGALVPSSLFDGAYFYCAKEDGRIVLEGQGSDIRFLNGSWYNTSKTAMLVQSGSYPSVGKIETQGECDVVFYNHSSGANYTFELAQSTNNFVWAHSGSTVISNACVLKVSADYALPNGPQTGSIRLTAYDAKSNPSVDLCGTTQIINGITTVGSMGEVTNSQNRAAMLILGAHDEDGTLDVPSMGSRITVKKIGTGELTVRRVKTEAMIVDGGRVKVMSRTEVGDLDVSGGVLCANGTTVKCTTRLVAAGGALSVRNGGVIDDADLADSAVSIAGLEVDVNESTDGRIEKFVPAAGGKLMLTGVAGEPPKVLPVKFGSVVGGSNLATWSVYVDSVRIANCKPYVLDDGQLRLKSNGLILVFK